ncbi:GHKL domain-containing protein [Lachnospiraceae bacterium MD1]|uniref:GHKL domain-containing protein n=1 Tax=Variimorphobacter saccharofermentans TaxID=2755051 RepID=A0A839JVY2_9FIRM|nr:ATP-binding protein [Variimorphobacter saccharofermentans]MBB2181825.1 GHKL domain-containing protein [Variimorphobacter saccharofermentans]
MYDVLNVCLDVIVALGQGYCLQYFLGSFLEGRGNDRRNNGLLVMVVYGVLRLGINFIMSSNFESFRIIGKMALLSVVVVLLALLFYKGVCAITAFLVVTYIAVSEITFFLSYVFLQLGGNLFDLWVWLLEKGYITVDTFEWIVQISATFLQIIFYGIFLVLLYFALWKIIRSFSDKDYRIQRTEMYFLLVPGMVGLLICVLLRIIMITIENDMPKLLYDRYPILTIIVPAILILSLLSILYVVKTFQNMIVLNREKNSRIILEKQIGSMQEHMEEMEHIYSGIRSMKHDMKNTLSVIMQLAGKEEEELQTYLVELNQNFDRLEFQFKTGNTVVDTLLNMKYHEVIRTIPDIRIDAERLLFSENMNIQSYDVGVIIGNALDNAIEACKKLKSEKQEAETFIRISTFKKGKMIFIEVENSFNGKVVKKKQSEFPATDKTDIREHGIGFLNIKHTAEKYHGAVDWSVDGKVFILSVMMKDERRTENEY